jgi:predicted enzyme related to lactoylglutathione lyase
MTNIDKHPAGSFCWIELHTTDQNAAKSFYGSLFGWEAHDNPMGPNDFYTEFKLQAAKPPPDARCVPTSARRAFLRTG